MDELTNEVANEAVNEENVEVTEEVMKEMPPVPVRRQRRKRSKFQIFKSITDGCGALCGKNHAVGDSLHSKIRYVGMLSGHTDGKATLTCTYLEEYLTVPFTHRGVRIDNATLGIEKIFFTTINRFP